MGFKIINIINMLFLYKYVFFISLILTEILLIKQLTQIEVKFGKAFKLSIKIITFITFVNIT